jgi:hypothetical protein
VTRLPLRAFLLAVACAACSDPTAPTVNPAAAGTGARGGVGGSAAGASGVGAGAGGAGATGAAGSGGTAGGAPAGGAAGSVNVAGSGGGGSAGVAGQGGVSGADAAGAAGASNAGGAAGSAGASGAGGLAGATGGGAGGDAEGAAGFGGASGSAGAGSGGAGAVLAAELHQFRFECPCKEGAANHTSDGNCNVTPETDRQTVAKTMGGDAGTVYDVTLRVRGLTEPNTYKNGMRQGERFYIGGTTNTPGYTSYMMTIADPPQHFFFNYNATTSHMHFVLDYEVTVKIRGGSQVTFDVDGDGSVPDGHQVSNFDDTVVPGVPPAPMPYDGQFVQLDVVSVAPAP